MKSCVRKRLQWEGDYYRHDVCRHKQSTVGGFVLNQLNSMLSIALLEKVKKWNGGGT